MCQNKGVNLECQSLTKCKCSYERSAVDSHWKLAAHWNQNHGHGIKCFWHGQSFVRFFFQPTDWFGWSWNLKLKLVLPFDRLYLWFRTVKEIGLLRLTVLTLCLTFGITVKSFSRPSLDFDWRMETTLSRCWFRGWFHPYHIVTVVVSWLEILMERLYICSCARSNSDSECDWSRVTDPSLSWLMDDPSVSLGADCSDLTEFVPGCTVLPSHAQVLTEWLWLEVKDTKIDTKWQCTEGLQLTERVGLIVQEISW